MVRRGQFTPAAAVLHLPLMLSSLFLQTTFVALAILACLAFAQADGECGVVGNCNGSVGYTQLKAPAGQLMHASHCEPKVLPVAVGN